MNHSIISPSKAHIWTRCTCYEPMPSSRAGNTGSEYHKLAEKALRDNSEAEYVVKPYVDYIKGLKGELHIEYPVKLDLLFNYSHDLNLGNGYCDAVVINERTTNIIDLKTGRIPVDPIRNLQLSIYAYCIMQEFGKTDKVNITIFQGTTKTWETTYDEIEKIIKEIVIPGVYLVLSGKKVREEGEYCRWCSCSYSCKTYINYLEAATTDPVELLDKAKHWSDLSDKIKEDVKNGKLKDDRLIVNNRSSFKWKEGSSIPDEFLQLIPVKPSKLLLESRPELSSLIEEKIITTINIKKD